MNDIVPADAHLYFPPPHKTKCTDVQRSVFDGNTEFNEDENQHITKFKAYCVKENQALKSLWTDNMILRFLYANNFKISKTLTSLKEHTLWRETCLPIQVDDELQKLINAGIIYFHGRDNQFRPIVILNLHMVDLKKHDVNLFIKVMTFWMEYVIQECMLPGQIESWIFVADMKGMGASALALSSMRKLFSFLQENYKCRLKTLYILNVTNAMYIPYQIVKKFLDDVTVQKIQFYKTQNPLTLFNTTNPEQVEQKYGGTAPNATHFWPPRIISNNYFVSPDDSKVLATKERYTSLYKSGYFKNMRVNRSLVSEDFDDMISPERTKKPALSAKFERRGIGSYDPALTHSATLENPGSDLFKTHSSPYDVHSKFRNENVEDDDQEGTDYAHYMEEDLDSVQKIRPIKHFRTSLISSLQVNGL